MPCNILVILMICVSVTSHAATQLPSTPLADTSAQPKIAKDSSTWRRDPFGAAEKSNAQAPITRGALKPPVIKPQTVNIVLQGILKSDNRFHALINGRIVKAGDQFDGLTIIRIERYKVIIKQESDNQIFDIYQGKIERGTK